MNNEKYENIKKLAGEELSYIEQKIISQIDVREILNSHIVRFLTAPSKKIRPLLTILYLKANNEELSQKQLNILASIELIHNASLIHDDIIDNSDFRRGIKSLSSEFGNKLGVICGDYLLSLAMEEILNLDCNYITEKIVKTLKQMCLGEINQNFDRFKIGTIEEYIEKIKQKTAYLFETALECCAFISNKDYNIEKIKYFGQNFGIAFQIKDDLLNILKNEDLKPVQSDIAQGIYTAPVIFAGNIENLEIGVEKTKDLLNNYIKNLLYQLKDIDNNIYKKALEELVELLKI